MECQIDNCQVLKLVEDLGLRYVSKNYIPRAIECLKVIRDTDISGFGHMFFRDVFICDTLENPSFLMPFGIYQMRLTTSPKFKMITPEIYIPKHSGVRIHAGNYRSDSKGCILVGVKSGTDCLKSSRDTLDRVIRVIRELNILNFQIC